MLHVRPGYVGFVMGVGSRLIVWRKAVPNASTVGSTSAPMKLRLSMGVPQL